jgi:hypothetical protein
MLFVTCIPPLLTSLSTPHVLYRHVHIVGVTHSYVSIVPYMNCQLSVYQSYTSLSSWNLCSYVVHCSLHERTIVVELLSILVNCARGFVPLAPMYLIIASICMHLYLIIASICMNLYHLHRPVNQSLVLASDWFKSPARQIRVGALRARSFDCLALGSRQCLDI